jgi:hypothetical protein
LGSAVGPPFVVTPGRGIPALPSPRPPTFPESFPFRRPFPRELEQRGLGVVVALSRIDGLTSSRVLKTPFYFQCAPLDSMPVDFSWEWNDYVTIDGTTHSNPRAINLDTITFSTLFVDDDTHRNFTLTTNLHVLTMARMLKAVGDAMTPFQLQYGQPRLWGVWDYVGAATLRSLHVEERYGELDARYLTVTFNSYEDAPAGTTRAVPAPAPVSTGGRLAAAVQPSHPGVVAVLDSSRLPVGLETLSGISKAYYHDPGNWAAIAKASGLTATSANENLPSTVGRFDPAARIIVPTLFKAL